MLGLGVVVMVVVVDTAALLSNFNVSMWLEGVVVMVVVTRRRRCQRVNAVERWCQCSCSGVCTRNYQKITTRRVKPFSLH